MLSGRAPLRVLLTIGKIKGDSGYLVDSCALEMYGFGLYALVTGKYSSRKRTIVCGIKVGFQT